ncbi:MAG: helix-turn-helix domain-containing protein [Roseburia sp.]|nr:helix-turn-helix domain-containing protein [Roseburia sp.]
MKLTYDRLSVGDRLRLKRTLLGFTQEEVAEKIDRATKYYADIERGNCGMSVETLMALSFTLDMSLDYMIYGKTCSEQEERQHTDEVTAIIETLNSLPRKQHDYALRLLKLFLCAQEGSDEKNNSCS